MTKKAPLWSFFIFTACIFSLPAVGVSPLHAGEVDKPFAIASAHPLATDAGMAILEKGGNAFDAAVTVSAVLAVVEPYGSGIGGGGFWLLHLANDAFDVMIDGRERAPLAAHRDLYLNEDGSVNRRASIDGALAAGIPGEPAALVHLAEQYGRLPLSVTLKPAIDIALKGFPVDEVYQRMAGWRLSALQDSMAASEIFLRDEQVPELGTMIKQPDLANTLRLLVEQGHDGFYRGEMADRLVKEVRQAGGIWTSEDLEAYRVIERQPVAFTFKDQRIVSAALPSSGGIVLAQILGILSRLDDSRPNDSRLASLTRKHLVIEAMRLAYRDRAEYLGDRDYVAVPVENLLSQSYLDKQASSINPEKALSSENLNQESEGHDTTHFSIIDKEGNRVAATLSINYPFGSGFVPEGTGVLLNDEMDDFSASPGVPNVYGLVGNEANAIAGGKRMLSSMSPTFVETDDYVAIVGTPGGSRIISMVLLAILDMQENRDSGPEQWVQLPRFHHQYLPDLIQYESGAFSEQEVEKLKSMGHQLKMLDDTYGNMQAIYLDKNTGEIKAASDPRGIGKATVGKTSEGNHCEENQCG